jgi:6-phosphofructokinase 1
LGVDASGNRLHKDIGILLRDVIVEEFKKQDFPVSLKYIDPSYIIRSAAANPNDSLFCTRLAHDAVHAAMAGKTDFVVGNWDAEFILLPIPMATYERKKIDMESDFWGSVIGTTRQPVSMKNK